ncbi:MAG: nicotinate (nicotinamide) nucleotide adenylyltransferase [Candidatus Kapaibacterium sp.]|jgi:nicotinate-nucleotide adenylyltransferase|nr:nicotinate (nicotinamide) nucleotide adenylyltransferase [Candidatus Kapabacteria bacterium]
MRIGLYGGSFNPVHNAHISMAQEFINIMQLDKLIVMPAYSSPFKKDLIKEVRDADRLQMLKIAFRAFDDVYISDFEIIKEGISYTIDTVKFIRNKYGISNEFYMLIGYDQLYSFHKWKDWKQILCLIKICAALRNPEKNVTLDEELDNYLIKSNYHIRFLNNKPLDISASKIRENISQGQDVSSLLPSEVQDYIKTHNLYL